MILMKPIYCCKVGVAGAGNITAATSAYELTNAICSVQLTEDKLVIVLNDDDAKKIGIREYHVVIPVAKDSKSLGKYLKEVFDGSDVPLELP